MRFTYIDVAVIAKANYKIYVKIITFEPLSLPSQFCFSTAKSTGLLKFVERSKLMSLF